MTEKNYFYFAFINLKGYALEDILRQAQDERREIECSIIADVFFVALAKEELAKEADDRMVKNLNL